MTSKNTGSRQPSAQKYTAENSLKPKQEEFKKQLSRGSGKDSGLISRHESGPIGQLGKFTSADTSDYLIKGKYRLLSFCKGGAFGDVFFAKHSEKGYDVAVKFVSDG